jgi:DNA-directed RNA polymerase specialized sigma24 family protein
MHPKAPFQSESLLLRKTFSAIVGGKRFMQVELQEIPVGGDLSEMVEKEESRRMLKHALTTLSGREREILSLKYAAGLKK